MKVKFQQLENLGLIRDHFLYSREVHGTGIYYSFFAEKDVDEEGNTNVYVMKYDWDSMEPEPIRLSGAEERKLIEDMLQFAQVRQEHLNRAADGRPVYPF